MKSALLDFILLHPHTWEEELTAEPYCLKISRDGNLVMLKYNQLSSDFSLPEVREARGIIFDETTWTCVCRAFDKFGNYGESYVPELDWSTAFVSQKIDGSLIKVYWYDGHWMAATNGTINAFDAPVGDAKERTFGDLFNMALYIAGKQDFTQKLDTNKCYMFELVSPYTKVVIPYENTEVYFLGSRDLITGQEYTFMEEVELAAMFRTPNFYLLTSLEEVSKAAAALNWDEEGYVVNDANKNRCKIKSPAYVRAHYMRTNSTITLKRLVSVVLNNEIEEFSIYAPEWRDAITKIYCAMGALEQLSYDCVNILSKFHFENRKEYYLFITEVVENKEMKNFLLKLYDYPGRTWLEYIDGWDENRWARCLESEVEL